MTQYMSAGKEESAADIHAPQRMIHYGFCDHRDILRHHKTKMTEGTQSRHDIKCSCSLEDEPLLV